MQKIFLEQYTGFLLSAAMRKCGDPDDAKDLTQETLLSALTFLSKGGAIEDIKGWLVTVLNRRYCDMLRKKRKLPTVSINTDIEEESDILNEIAKKEEAESIRREIAFLSQIHREVLVRYYMNNQSVDNIANTLHIPAGTVKSRLSASREAIKKGICKMDNYGKQSYEPEILHVGISGHQGMNGEPSSITDNDLIAQNVLIIAYDEPLTESELAGAIGISTAYMEPVVEKLVEAHLMKRIGRKVYTDFIIFRPEDSEKHIEAEKALIGENFEAYWKPLQNGLMSVRSSTESKRFSAHVQAKLEFFWLMQFLASGFYTAGRHAYDWNENRPDRPNGGRWDAMGHAYPKNYDLDSAELMKYAWGGARRNYWHDTLGAKEISLHVYDTPFEKKRYYHLKNNLDDSGLAQMLYIMHTGINPSDTGINMMFFENIPHLIECGVLKRDADKTSVDIPVLLKSEYDAMIKIHYEVVNKFAKSAHDSLKAHLDGRITPIPKHLISVPLQFRYMKAMIGLNMLMVYEAKKRGYILKDVDYPCPPMVLVVER